MYFMSGGQGRAFAEAAEEMTNRIRKLGPNPLKRVDVDNPKGPPKVEVKV